MRDCITHHHACDCREQKFAEIEAENRSLRKRLQYANGKLSEAMMKLDELRKLLSESGSQGAAVEGRDGFMDATSNAE